MPRYERPRRNSRVSHKRKRDSYDGRPRRKNSRGNSRDKGDLNMTRVTCASCGDRCEVPFRPTTNKPVYCKDCFGKKDDSNRRDSNRRGSRDNSDRHQNKYSERDLDIINEKLNKIMKALDIH